MTQFARGLFYWIRLGYTNNIKKSYMGKFFLLFKLYGKNVFFYFYQFCVTFGLICGHYLKKLFILEVWVPCKWIPWVILPTRCEFQSSKSINKQNMTIPLQQGLYYAELLRSFFRFFSLMYTFLI